MTDVASRELRNNTRGLLDRVSVGETITITVDGRPVAELSLVSTSERWMPPDRFVREILPNQADAGLQDDLDALSDETTDDLPFV